MIGQHTSLISNWSLAMQIQTFDLDKVSIFVIQDRRIIATNTGGLRAAIRCSHDENKEVVLDLGNVEFIDSVGLGAIVTCLREARAEGREIKLCRTSKQVQSLFELVNLHKSFQVFGSLEEALQSYSGPDSDQNPAVFRTLSEFACAIC